MLSPIGSVEQNRTFMEKRVLSKCKIGLEDHLEQKCRPECTMWWITLQAHWSPMESFLSWMLEAHDDFRWVSSGNFSLWETTQLPLTVMVPEYLFSPTETLPPCHCRVTPCCCGLVAPFCSFQSTTQDPRNQGWNAGHQSCCRHDPSPPQTKGPKALTQGRV